jgi:hypothetical protein
VYIWCYESTLHVTCATEGSTIYYEHTEYENNKSVWSSDPPDSTNSSTEYVDGISVSDEWVPSVNYHKIKVIAYKDGMLLSEIITGQYMTTEM